MNLKNTMYFLAGMAGTSLVAAVCVAVNSYYRHQPGIVHTINGYNIVKKEWDGSTTVFTHLVSDVFGERSDTLYIGVGNENHLDDIVLVDEGCDSKVDVIRDRSGISIRVAKTVEDMLKLHIGAGEAFEMADGVLARYKSEFAGKIRQAEKERDVMLGKKGI